MARRKQEDRANRSNRVNKEVSPQEVREKKAQDFSQWKPITELGRRVKDREITDIDEILDNSLRILEPEITDSLLHTEQDLLLIGQSKGKFGGGARRVFRQTQKKTMEGNKPKFSTIAVVGDRNGHIGVGLGKAKETVPAREKAVRRAKINIFKIRRGCGSWQCDCKTPHSIPFAVTGKCGSVEITLMPAPKGKGIVCQKDIAKIVELGGIKDIWAKTRGQTKNRVNFIYACEQALKKLSKMKVRPVDVSSLAILEGASDQPREPAGAEAAEIVAKAAAAVAAKDAENAKGEKKEQKE
ncbi:30S ribosomal protein S5 [Candidatus Woesearchaeota archaeon]|nr:30S ribosomal protein S5 [Candidatus Woesearchaeota archaeon]